MRSTLAFQISLMDCSAGDDDGGGACSGEAKPPLSHTHSLPTPKHKPSQRSSSEEGRSATTVETSENDEKTSTSSQSSNVRGSRAGSERHHSKLGHPKHSVSSGISRSQSVRTKGSSNKVSFSNLPFKCLYKIGLPACLSVLSVCLDLASKPLDGPSTLNDFFGLTPPPKKALKNQTYPEWRAEFFAAPFAAPFAHFCLKN